MPLQPVGGFPGIPGVPGVLGVLGVPGLLVGAVAELPGVGWEYEMQNALQLLLAVFAPDANAGDDITIGNAAAKTLTVAVSLRMREPGPCKSFRAICMCH